MRRRKMSQPIRVLTICRVGLSRSLALTDVLKCHFQPVDVIPVGFATNSPETLKMLIDWADHVVLMREKFKECLEEKIGNLPEGKSILICDVGPDIHGYAGQGRAILIDKTWRWARANQSALGVNENNG
jgi:predicted protein tyrosine phosphatase